MTSCFGENTVIQSNILSELPIEDKEKVPFCMFVLGIYYSSGNMHVLAWKYTGYLHLQQLVHTVNASCSGYVMSSAATSWSNQNLCFDGSVSVLHSSMQCNTIK